MSDLISRQEALIAIMDLYPGMPRVPWLRKKWTRRYEPYIDAEKAIRRLPSAEPERKTGKWIRNDNGTYSCSVCQSWIPEEQHYYARYCLYCGAKMEDNE